MANPVDVFKALAGGKILLPELRVRRFGQEGEREGPIGGVPGLYARDAAFIAGVMARTKWAQHDPPKPIRRAIREMKAEIKRLKREIRELEGERTKRRRWQWRKKTKNSD